MKQSIQKIYLDSTKQFVQTKKLLRVFSLVCARENWVSPRAAEAEAEAGSGSGGSGCFVLEAEAEAQPLNIYRFRFRFFYY